MAVPSWAHTRVSRVFMGFSQNNYSKKLNVSMNKREKTPLLGDEKAQRAMKELLSIIKRHRGLTSFMEKQGINGKWLNPDKPYDIRFSKLSKILEVAHAYRETDETFTEEWNHMCKLYLKILKG